MVTVGAPLGTEVTMCRTHPRQSQFVPIVPAYTLEVVYSTPQPANWLS